jgi:putative transposase
MMIKTLKVRLYPNEKQKILLEKHFGSCRFVWNYFLELRTRYYAESKAKGKPQGLNYFKTCKLLTELKKEKEWLYEVSNPSLQWALRKLDNAFTAFFRRNANYPRFKSKKDSQYFIVPSRVKATQTRIIIPKFLEGIRYRDKTDASTLGRIKQAVITKVSDRYFASLCYEVPDTEKKTDTEFAVGVDRGISRLATLSDGTAIENPRFLQSFERKLRREHRRLSRKVKGSKNRAKQRLRLAKVYLKLSDSRTDFGHKLSGAIAKSFSTVVLEDLNIQGMVHNTHLAKHILDASWGALGRMLGYKAVNAVKIGRFEPSSKTCSNCGRYNPSLKLSDRIFRCEECGLIIDRDLNASINIRNIGLVKVGWGTPEYTPVETPLAGYLSRRGISYVSLKQEPKILQG